MVISLLPAAATAGPSSPYSFSLAVADVFYLEGVQINQPIQLVGISHLFNETARWLIISSAFTASRSTNSQNTCP